jgi:hypothetical protein
VEHESQEGFTSRTDFSKKQLSVSAAASVATPIFTDGNGEATVPTLSFLFKFMHVWVSERLYSNSRTFEFANMSLFTQQPIRCLTGPK